MSSRAHFPPIARILRTGAACDGRWIAAGMFLMFCLALKVTALIAAQPVFELPPFSWIGPMAPYFADLRGVVSWSDQFYAGHVSDITTLRDPWNRPVNYQYWWLYLHGLGVNGGNVMAFGYLNDLAYLIAAFFVLGRLDAFGGIVAGAFLISYAVMFGLERANVDLLMFALLAVALAARRYLPLATFLIGFTAILKLHPLFAFGALLHPPWRRTLPWLAAGLAFFALGISDHWHNFLATMSVAPNMRSGVLSFGMTTLGLELIETAGRPDLYPIALASGVAMLIIVTGAAAWLRPAISLKATDDRELFAFRIGAGIYLGCYLLGTNHDYRAACLLFCLPLLLLLLRREAARRWAFTTLLLLLVSMNWIYLAGDGNALEFVLKQGVAWALFFCLAGVYIATLPIALQWPKRIAWKIAR